MALPKKVISTKSTAISLRLEPDTKAALDFLARQERKPTSRLIDEILYDFVRDGDDFHRSNARWGKAKNLENYILNIWDIDPLNALLKLTRFNYNLLNTLENELLNQIFINEDYWKDGKARDFKERNNESLYDLLDIEKIREEWDVIYKSVVGEKKEQ